MPALTADEFSRARPRERLEAERTRPSVQIQDSCSGEIQQEDAHPRFSNAVERWSDVRSAGCANFSSPPAAGDYPHTTTSAIRACR